MLQVGLSYSDIPADIPAVQSKPRRVTAYTRQRASVALASLGDDSCRFDYRHSRPPFDQDRHTHLRSDSGDPLKTFNFSRNGVPLLDLTHGFSRASQRDL